MITRWVLVNQKSLLGERSLVGHVQPSHGLGKSGSLRALPARITRNIRFLVLLWLMLQGSFGVSAAYDSGTLVGSIAGPASERLAAVRVRLLNEESGQLVSETATDAAGRFAFHGLPAGTYTLEVSLHGWQPCARPHLEVTGGTTLEVSVILVPLKPSAPLRASSQALALEALWGTQLGDLSIQKLLHARNLWSILESQEPSTVTDRLDVGGLGIGAPALFGALGASWTETVYSLNGLNVTDPYIPGRPLFEPDVDVFREVQVVSGAKRASFAASGQEVRFTTAEPSAKFHGTARLFLSGGRLQSNNMDARLRRFEFPGPERLNHLADGSFQVGGRARVFRASIPAFISFSNQQLSKTLGGFSAPIDARVYRAFANALLFDRASQRLNLLYAGQHLSNSREGADPRVESASTTLGNHNFHQFQLHWRKMANSSTMLAVRFGVVHAHTSSEFQPGITGLNSLDLPQMSQTGPAPLATTGTRSRFEADLALAMIREGPVRFHSLTVGLGGNRDLISNHWESSGGMQQILVEGQGSEVVRWNTPTQDRSHLSSVSVFIEDAWRPFRGVRLPVGLRLERASGRAVGAAVGPRWVTLEPRTALVVPLTRQGLVLRASWSRYTHVLQGRYLDFGNPAALAGSVYRWHDLNADRQAQPGKISPLLRVFGGRHSAIDPRLGRPFTDEISLGLDQDFGARFRASVRFFRRDSHRLIGQVNLGVPASGFTPVSVLDPGNDGIAGTTDDQTLILYNRNPSALGQDFLLLTNPPGHRSYYKGFEIRLTKPLLRLWQFSASFTAMRTMAATNPGNSVFENDAGSIGSLGTDPNTFLFAASRTYFDRAFIGKATGYYAAPHGFRLGIVAKYYDGLPFGRLLFVDGFNQGPFLVRATPRGHPGGFQTQFNFTLDARLAREFRLRRGTLSSYLDFFNVLNMNRNTREADLTGPSFESRVPLAIQAPRLARLGVEWDF